MADLALFLARELCTHDQPCDDAIKAARRVLANQAAVLRFLERVAPHPHGHRLLRPVT